MDYQIHFSMSNLSRFYDNQRKLWKNQGIKIAWIGDGNNVCNSMIYGAALSGATMSIATRGFEPKKNVVKDAKINKN